MRVRGGRVAKKNNWTPDVREYSARRQSEIQIERTEPGRGVRHVVTVVQQRDFLEILPDWDEPPLAWRRSCLSGYRSR